MACDAADTYRRGGSRLGEKTEFRERSHVQFNFTLIYIGDGFYTGRTLSGVTY